MVGIRSRHHTGSIWATLSGSPWATVDTLTFAPSKRPFRVRRRVHGGAQTWSDARCPAEVALVVPMRLNGVQRRHLETKYSTEM